MPHPIFLDLNEGKRVVYEVCQLETCGLWLYCDHKGTPELCWRGDDEEIVIAGRGISRELPRTTASERQKWLDAVEKWQSIRDDLRATGDCLYQAASSFAQSLKGNAKAGPR